MSKKTGSLSRRQYIKWAVDTHKQTTYSSLNRQVYDLVRYKIRETPKNHVIEAVFASQDNPKEKQWFVFRISKEMRREDIPRAILEVDIDNYTRRNNVKKKQL